MREKHSPGVADPFMKVNWTLRSFGDEIRSNIIDAK
jgi:hypothetical protein